MELNVVKDICESHGGVEEYTINDSGSISSIEKVKCEDGSVFDYWSIVNYLKEVTS